MTSAARLQHTLVRPLDSRQPRLWGKAEAANPATGSVTLFKVTAELRGISDKDIADNQFQVPQGWERVDSSSW